uniref:Uncharacterized protein n=1 Tax=Helianthus annuus TaxID=4232 RepID=A0A251TI79_HELAN
MEDSCYKSNANDRKKKELVPDHKQSHKIEDRKKKELVPDHKQSHKIEVSSLLTCLVVSLLILFPLIIVILLR